MTFTAMPTPPSTNDPSTFATRADAVVAWLQTFVAEMNTYQSNLTTIAAGSPVSLSYRFSTTTTDSDPGSGYLRLSNASQSSATVMRVSNTDAGAVDVATLLGTFDDSTSTVKGFIRLINMNDPTKWLIFSLSALASPTGYKNITVAHVVGSAASPFVADDDLLLTFARSGDKGDTGAGGSYDETTADLGTIVKPTAGTISEKYCKLALYASGSYTLPDLSTISGDIKFGLVCPSNVGSPPSSVATSDGWTISTGFSAGTEKSIMPTSVATAHGTWDSCTMTPPTLDTITGSASNTANGTANLDTNLDVILFHDATNWYVAAANPSANDCGAAVTIGAYYSENYAAIFKDSTTTYVAFVATANNETTIRAGSVNTGTLAITQGAAVTDAANMVDTPIKLSAGNYLTARNNASDLKSYTVSTTTVTAGTPAASGAVGTGVGSLKIARSSDTEAFIAYLATGGGTSSTRQMCFRIVTHSAGTLTLQTAAGAATNICKSSELRFLLPYTEGSSYIACAMDGTTSTTGNYYGGTASGTSAVIGSISAKTNNLPAQFSAQTWKYQKKRPIKAYNSTTMVFGHLAAGPIAATISGSTLTWGSSGGPATTCDFLTDTTAGTSFYAVGASAFDKITISGTTISSSWQVSGVSPTIIASDTLTDKAASYSSVWYTWTLPSMSCALTATKWLYASGNNLIMCGTIS